MPWARSFWAFSPFQPYSLNSFRTVSEKKLEVIGETHGGCTVAEMLTGDIVESAFQGKMLAYVLIHAHLGIEIGWRIGWRKRVAAGAPDHVGCQAPASRQ